MSKKTKSVLDGGPVTKETTDINDHKKITAHIKGASPIAARASEFASIITTGVIAVASIGGALLIEDASLAQRLLMSSLSIPTMFVAKRFFYNAFSRTKPVVHTTDTMSFSRSFRTQYFDMGIPGHWVIYDHEKKGMEERKREIKKAKPDGKKFFIYIKAFHEPIYIPARVLSYDYMGQRNDFMVFDTLENAQQALSRLTAIGEVIDGYGNTGSGTSLTPKSQWGNQAGGLTTDHDRGVL